MLKRRVELVATLQTAAAALDKHIGKRKLYIRTKASTGHAVAARLRAHARAQDDAAALHARWLQATRALRVQLRTEIVPAMFDVRAQAQGVFGPHSAEFREFGFRPAKKPGPKGTKSKAAAVVKAAATRKARGTLGRRQRLAIKAATTEATREGQ
jgi:hypothetical protein